MQPFGPKKIPGPLGTNKKSRNLSGQKIMQPTKKIMQLLGTNKSSNLSGQKILQPLRTKKLRKILGTKKIIQPFRTKNLATSWGKKHETSQNNY